jgi:hypothetical protein
MSDGAPIYWFNKRTLRWKVIGVHSNYTEENKNFGVFISSGML